MSDVEITVRVSSIRNATDRTLWNAQERVNHFLSDLDVDVKASIGELLRHWGLEADVTVAVS